MSTPSHSRNSPRAPFHRPVSTSFLSPSPPLHLRAEIGTYLGLAHCSKCDLKENLWLCLTCGALGCGRKLYGGVGGNGHALSHFEESAHPLCVKLGTITPEGNAGEYPPIASPRTW